LSSQLLSGECEIFADRVVVVSLGGLPSGLNQEEFGYKSVRHNYLIADLLARTGYIEEAGTGIGRIRQDAELNHCQYEINYTQDWFTVTFYRQSSDKLPDNAQNYPVNHDKYPVNYLVNYLQSNEIQNIYSDKQLQNLAQILNIVADNEYNRVKLAELTGLSLESVKNIYCCSN
jgi:predicted HTH transcriptional regulator